MTKKTNMRYLRHEAIKRGKLENLEDEVLEKQRGRSKQVV